MQASILHSFLRHVSPRTYHELAEEIVLEDPDYMIINPEHDIIEERQWFWEETGYGIPADEIIAVQPFCPQDSDPRLVGIKDLLKAYSLVMEQGYFPDTIYVGREFYLTVVGYDIDAGAYKDLEEYILTEHSLNSSTNISKDIDEVPTYVEQLRNFPNGWGEFPPEKEFTQEDFEEEVRLNQPGWETGHIPPFDKVLAVANDYGDKDTFKILGTEIKHPPEDSHEGMVYNPIDGEWRWL